jgi:hypothetical protein
LAAETKPLRRMQSPIHRNNHLSSCSREYCYQAGKSDKDSECCADCPRCSPFQIIRLSCLRMGAAKDCGSAAAYVLAVPSGDASQSWESRRSEIGKQHDQFFIHTDHGLLF